MAAEFSAVNSFSGFTFACVYVCVGVYVYVSVCVCVCVSVCVRVCIRVCVCGVSVLVVHMCVYMYACVYMCVCARIYIHTISNFRTHMSDFHTHSHTLGPTYRQTDTGRHIETQENT